jgi:drug/metabolite transporter (DMT)-like permease
LIGAQKTSLLSCAEPFAAAVLAVLWLGVRWTLMDWLGAALVLATIFLLARAKPEQKLLAEVTGDIRSH